MKRRLPRGVRREYAAEAVRQGRTGKTVAELLHLWTSKEKRRTHKRERREGREQVQGSQDA